MKVISSYLKRHKTKAIGIGALGLLLHVIFFQSINSIMILPFLFYWMLLGIVFRFSEKYFFGIALFFLIISVPPFLFGNVELAERLSVWEFLFLILGFWQFFLFDILATYRKKK